ncbi:MAG: MBL fold metallo-hydrolase [Clostridia bacterium]|nr:MBL fold metallo-hydrolase [Clostridia bacterium]
MGANLTVTYYLHSGFSCATDKVLLIFDYWQGEHQELALDRRIDPADFDRYEEVYVFISHSHPDHYDPVVYEWHKDHPVVYIVGYDMPVGTRGRRMNPGDTIPLSRHVTVKAFDSTDLGVSFLVTLDGIRIFHAGDLNFWHWREESTVAEIEEAEAEFHRCCAPLLREKTIDVCFFPVDPRQGRLYDAGANYFIMTVKPRLLIPMHFWGRSEMISDFARRAGSRSTEVYAMIYPREELQIRFADDGFMTISPVPPPTRPRAVLPDEDDPFSESDLPVDFR